MVQNDRRPSSRRAAGCCRKRERAAVRTPLVGGGFAGQQVRHAGVARADADLGSPTQRSSFNLLESKEITSNHQRLSGDNRGITGATTSLGKDRALTRTMYDVDGRSPPTVQLASAAPARGQRGE